jgi:hypothetical protein
MRKCILALSIVFLVAGMVQAQDTTASKSNTKKTKEPKKDWSKVTIGDRANDHFMIQSGYDGWMSMPDSIQTSGFSRHLNVYVMLDKPFKTDPRWSVGLGVGIGSSNIFFENTSVDLKGAINPSQITFRDVSKENHFKKYKLATVWAEVPIELRHISNPLNSDGSFKWSIGAKVGTMISGYTKGKNLQSSTGQSLYGDKYIAKEKDRKFLNNLRIAPTARIGFGNFTVYGAYQITTLFREGQGPDVRPYSIGLCISGL